MSAPRYALYYAPAPAHPLWTRASAWLGRDAADGAEVDRPPFPELADLDLDALTEDPRHYGFHATLTAPFELAPGKSEAELAAHAATFAADRRTFTADIGPDALGPFLAFRPAGDASEIQALHEACVRGFHAFRAPLSDFDLARRRKAPLTPAQDALLVEWGYPYVFGEFRFHMTLTGRIADAEVRGRVLAALSAHFADLAGPHRFESVAIFKQPTREAPFHVLAQAPFGS